MELEVAWVVPVAAPQATVPTGTLLVAPPATMPAGSPQFETLRQQFRWPRECILDVGALCGLACWNIILVFSLAKLRSCTGTQPKLMSVRSGREQQSAFSHGRNKAHPRQGFFICETSSSMMPLPPTFLSLSSTTSLRTSSLPCF